MAIAFPSSSLIFTSSQPKPKPFNLNLLSFNNSPSMAFSVSARATPNRSLHFRCQATADTAEPAPGPVSSLLDLIDPNQSWMFEETGFRGPDIWNTTWYPKAKDHIMTEKTWYVVDATDLVLGRMASAIAIYMRGKNLATYTPSVDMGAFVIVVNAEKVYVSGKKRTQKLYRRHSGRPGGMTVETFDQLQNRIPERIIEHAVRGMLPKGRLGRQLFTHLKVYKGPEHPHEAQKPIALPLRDKRIRKPE